MEMEIVAYRIESAILTAIERTQGVGRCSRVDENVGRNILRARDYQYAPDTASPFLFGERKRSEVPETDRGETSRFRVLAELLVASAFKLGNFRAFSPSLAPKRNRLRVAFSYRQEGVVIKW